MRETPKWLRICLPLPLQPDCITIKFIAVGLVSLAINYAVFRGLFAALSGGGDAATEGIPFAASPAAGHRYSGGSVQFSELYYFWRQLAWIAVGIPVMIGISMMQRERARRIRPPISRSC